MRKCCLHLFSAAFGPILFILACNEDMHKISEEFKFRPDRTTDYGVSCPWASKKIPIKGKCCLHASLIIFDQIIIKVAGSQDRHKSSVEFDFGPNQTTRFGVTCPWVTKISHFWTWISLKPAGQSWSNFICSIIRVGERLLKVLGQIDFGTLDSGERSLPFGLLVVFIKSKFWNRTKLASETCDMQFWIMPVFMIHVDALRMGGSDSQVFYFTHFRTELLFLAIPVTVAEGKWTHSLMSTIAATENK